jgi:hypothetical protein
VLVNPVVNLLRWFESSAIEQILARLPHPAGGSCGGVMQNA